ncbi:MAG: phage portal protein, partial [Phycisphaeraceae bacterium]
WVLDLDTGRRVVALYPVAPPQMRPVKNERTGEVQAWKYRAAGRYAGQEETLAPDEVHTIIDPDFENTHDPLRGLSPRQAVAMAISQYFKADVANESSLDHGVEPGGALQTDEFLSELQRDDIKQEVREHHSGVRNRRRFMLLHGGLRWQQVGAAFKDMEFTELKKMARTDIAAAFGVPGPVINYFEDSNYAHANAAQEAFYTNTILPRGARLAEEWETAALRGRDSDRALAVVNAERRKLESRQRCCTGFRRARQTARRSSRRFYAWFDSSGVAAVQKATLERAQQAKTWFDMGTPLNAIIRSVDAPFEEVPWGEVGYLPIGLRPANEDVLDTIDDPDGGEPEAGLLSGGGQARSRRRAQKPVADALRASEGTRANLWAQWRKSWEGLESSARGRLKRHFYELRGEVLRNLEKAADQLGPPDIDKAQRTFQPDHRRDVIGTLLFSLEAANDSISVKVGRLMREAYRLGGEQAMTEAAQARGQEADQADPFNIDDPRVRELMRARDIRLKDVNKTVRRRLASRLADAIDGGQTIAEMQDMIREEFNLAGSRAATIARTEVGASVEEARSEGRRQAGVPLKSWLSSRKETGRPEHAATERETMRYPIADEDPFTIVGTGIECMHPRGSGDPGQDINCGCTTLARYPDDELRSVLDRYRAHGFLSYEQLVKRDAARLESQQQKDGE